LLSDETEPVNIGNTEEVTMLELAEAVQDAVGNHPGVELHPRPTDDPMVRRPYTTRAENILGWKAQISLRQGLEPTLVQGSARSLTAVLYRSLPRPWGSLIS
jgi:dTDP-glucose 4,6-dehydratase